MRAAPRPPRVGLHGIDGGNWAGAAAGAASGAAAGSVVPVYGTIVGGIVGAAGGYFSDAGGGAANDTQKDIAQIQAQVAKRQAIAHRKEVEAQAGAATKIVIAVVGAGTVGLLAWLYLRRKRGAR